MPKHSTLRPLLAEDLDAVLRIQRQCYHTALLEDGAALAAKIAAANQYAVPTAWCAEHPQGALLAYAIAYPLNPARQPPRWNTPCAPAPVADATHLYVHDIAVAPAARRARLAERLLAQVLAQGRALHLARAALVAVQGAQTYWRRQGFVLSANNAPLLDSFGTDAQWMERANPHEPAPRAALTALCRADSPPRRAKVL